MPTSWFTEKAVSEKKCLHNAFIMRVIEKENHFMRELCSSTPETLLERAFGYSEGSFTGAKKEERRGFLN